MSLSPISRSDTIIKHYRLLLSTTGRGLYRILLLAGLFVLLTGRAADFDVSFVYRNDLYRIPSFSLWLIEGDYYPQLNTIIMVILAFWLTHQHYRQGHFSLGVTNQCYGWAMNLFLLTMSAVAAALALLFSLAEFLWCSLRYQENFIIITDIGYHLSPLDFLLGVTALTAQIFCLCVLMQLIALLWQRLRLPWLLAAGVFLALAVISEGLLTDWFFAYCYEASSWPLFMGAMLSLAGICCGLNAYLLRNWEVYG